MSIGTDLVKKIYQDLVDRYGPSYLWETRLPTGLRLELHPRLRYMLWTDPDLNDYQSFISVPRGPENQFRVPVKYNPELPANSWKLVIVTEEELTKGVVEWEP
jgi:hypothetical protein